MSMTRRRSPARFALAATLVLTFAAAGCVGDDGGEDPTPTPTPTPPTDVSPTPPTDEPPEPPAPPKPDNVKLTEEGDMQGGFEKRWTWAVAADSFDAFTITFTLTGFQGAPAPLAHVRLQVADAEGTVVKDETVGTGGAETVQYSFVASDVTSTGEWSLSAVADDSSGAPLPSGGLAHYALDVAIVY